MRDARRRNRNIGTIKAGHGQDNRMEVPLPGPSQRGYWERLENPVSVLRSIDSRYLPFVVEPTREGYFYPVTLDDLVALIRLAPVADLIDLACVVLRQPTEKQATLVPVWGRMVFHAKIAQVPGPALIIDAQRASMAMRWPKSLQPWEALELQALRNDGHAVTTDQRYHHISAEPEAMRATVLYRTVAHELGHLQDYRLRVLTGDRDDQEFNRRVENYWARPTREREEYADRYASEFRRGLATQLPFPQLFDRARVKRDGLDPNWFQPRAI